ncbi:HNH endonuclease signature motif containing protein [Dermacoccus abyssi]|uniref:HNH endonuclease signature motif containing protein n=1 Tax=Dermacoccus abyssi TaxID=322596 RepID=UPI002AD2557F|nr:HNH endonuclease signature motif containing protein [Dermacoccus abyssi]
METTQRDDVAEVLAAVRALPLEARVEAWHAVGVELFEVASRPTIDWGESSALAVDAVTVDEELAQLDAERRALEELTVTAAYVSRSADATMHAFAAAHARVVTRHDVLEVDQWESDPRQFVPGEFAADDLAARLGVRVGTAEAWAEAGDAVRASLPRMFVMAGAGEMRMTTCETVLRELEHLAPAERESVEGMLVSGRALLGGSAAVKRRVRRLLASLGLSAPADEDASEALVEVSFREHPDQPRLTQMTVVMDADQAWQVQAAIDARARQLAQEHERLHGGATRYRMNRARVDAFVDLLLGSVRFDPIVRLTVPVRCFEDGTTPGTSMPFAGQGSGMPVPFGAIDRSRGCSAQGGSGRGVARPAAGQAPWGALYREAEDGVAPLAAGQVGDGVGIGTAGQRRAATAPRSITRVADLHVPGVGVVSAACVERLAGTVGSAFTVALVDEKRGVTRWTSRFTYRPSITTRRFVEQRDEHCRFPGCMRPGEFCDADHVVPYADGGATSGENLQLLCRHHHRAKTFGGWAVVMRSDGVCVWNSPTGTWYRTDPADPTAYEITSREGYALIA